MTPCGYGRNAFALAARGCTVVGLDKDERRLAALQQIETSFIAKQRNFGIGFGKIFTTCADLKRKIWPFAPSSFSAIICIHFSMINLVPLSRDLDPCAPGHDNLRAKRGGG